MKNQEELSDSKSSSLKTKIGTLFAIGTGPSSSDFLTEQAKKAICSSETIFYPSTKKSSKAFDFVKKQVDVSQKKCEPLLFSMTKDEKISKREYECAKEKIEDALKVGNIALLTIGDVSICSTAAKIARLVKNDGFPVRFVSGISSISASFSALCLDLGSSESLFVTAGDRAFLSNEIPKILSEKGAKAFIKMKKYLPQIIQEIKTAGRLSYSHLVFHVGSADELIFSNDDLLTLPENIIQEQYMSVLIVEG